jgi:hypothetical protein
MSITRDYSADVLDADGDGLVTIDVRTLPADRLRALHAEAAAAGDDELTDTIAELLRGR